MNLAAKVVADALVEHMDWAGDDAGGNARPSLDTLASETATSRRTVARAVNELVAAGFLDFEVGGGHGVTTSYSAAIPLTLLQGRHAPEQQGHYAPEDQGHGATEPAGTGALCPENWDNDDHLPGRDAPRPIAPPAAGAAAGILIDVAREHLGTFAFDTTKVARAAAPALDAGWTVEQLAVRLGEELEGQTVTRSADGLVAAILGRIATAPPGSTKPRAAGRLEPSAHPEEEAGVWRGGVPQVAAR